MDYNEEYHDPDYPEAPAIDKEETPKVSEEGKIQIIKNIVRREFQIELDVREREVDLIDQRMSQARHYLHQLRHAIVNNYYNCQKLQLSSGQIEDEVAAQTEPRARVDVRDTVDFNTNFYQQLCLRLVLYLQVSFILRNAQRRIHPSVQKLLGKNAVPIEEIFKSRAPRKARRDYSAMVQKRDYTIAADTTKSLRPDKKESVDTETSDKPDNEEVQVPSGSKPKKVPRQIDPKINNVITVDEVTRNQMKHRYRIIIGNTSKYAPPASRRDRSTHKWLLYARGAPVLTALTVRLHHSYAPHHTVHIDKPPFQLSRRGWGEFPARITLHFAMPDLNRPATISHTIKLDRHYTGLQTLGAETVVDVWLYSTPEMLEFEQKDDGVLPSPTIKEEVEQVEDIEQVEEDIIEKKISESSDKQTDSWLDFFSKDTSEVNVDEMLVKNIKKEINTEKMETDETEHLESNHNHDEMDAANKLEPHLEDRLPVDFSNVTKKRIMKYMNPATGKIYYLEMDRTLDLTKVKEIVINSDGDVKTAKISPIRSSGLRYVRKKKGQSLLKPEVKKKLENEPIIYNYTHIENDHCYLATNWNKVNMEPIEEIKDKYKVLIHSTFKVISKFSCVRAIVSYLLKHIPLISEDAKDVDFVSNFPFVVESDEKYWKLDFAKRRNIEWSRAKLINKLLTENFKTDPSKIWRTKQILVYSRFHGYYPVRPETRHEAKEEDEWSSWNDLEDTRKFESNFQEHFPNESDLCSLSVFNSSDYITNDTVVELDISGSDEEIEIVGDIPVKEKIVLPDKPVSENVLPVDNDDRLKFLFIEKKCEDIGIELRNEDIGHGYSYSSVHSVLLTAAKCFAEELIRTALARQLVAEGEGGRVWVGWSRPRVSLQHVSGAARAPRLRLVTSSQLGTAAAPLHPPL